MRTLADRGYRDVGRARERGLAAHLAGRRQVRRARVPLAQIDHVLVGERLAALGMTTLAVPGSDHRAVVATVALK